MSSFDQWAASQEAVVAILKKRFPNLTVEEVLKISSEIVKAVLLAHQA